MAVVPYEPAGNVTQPDSRPPDTTFHPDVNANMFGANIGNALQGLAEGLETQGQLFREVKTDDVWGQTQKGLDTMTHGDPSHMVPGPDGTMVPDTGFLGTRGQDTLSVYGDRIKAMDDYLKSQRGLLTDARSKVEFDKQSQAYRSYILKTWGNHYDQQSQTYATTVNGLNSTNALNGISRDAGDDNLFQQHLQQLQQYYVKDAQVKGEGAQGAQAAVSRAQQDGWKQRIESIAGTDPGRAYKMAQDHQSELGVYGASVLERLEERKSQANGKAAGDQAIAAAKGGTAPAPSYATTHQGVFTAVGDSYAAGFGSAANGKAPETAVRSLQPPAVINLLRGQNVTNGQGEPARGLTDDDLRGNGPIFISTGVANDPNSAALVGTEMAIIRDRLQKVNGTADMSRVHVSGILPSLDKNGIGANATIQKLVEGAGANFHPINQSDDSGDHIHPSQAAYHRIARNAMGEGAPPARESGLPVQKAAFTPGAPPSASPPARPATPTPGGPVDTAALIRQEEGYVTTPIWDTNHWRIGYSSDTVTHADGTVEPVTAFTRITKEDADRDLARRIQQKQTQLSTALGADNWNKLSPGAQAAMTSVGYNYGKYPQTVLDAAKTGDSHAVAEAIRALPINVDRRKREAALADGGKFIAAPGGAGSHDFGAGRRYSVGPGMEPPPSGSSMNVGAGPASPNLPIQNAAAEEPGPTPPPRAPAPEEMSPDQVKAAALAEIDRRTDLTDKEKEIASRGIIQQMDHEAIIEQSNERAKKQKSEDAENEYIASIPKGKAADIFELASRDPRLTPEAKIRMMNVAKAYESDPEKQKREFGPDFAKMLSAITSQPGTPGHISDPSQIYQAVTEGGGLTFSGAQKLAEVQKSMNKGPDEAHVGMAMNLQLARIKRAMSFEEEPTYPGMPALKDPAGQAAFEKFVQASYLPSFDAWKAAGKNPYDFINDPEREKTMLAPFMRSRADMAMAKVVAAAQATGEPPSPEQIHQIEHLPPDTVKPEVWTKLVDSPPATPSGPLKETTWVTALRTFAENPTPDMIAKWDAAPISKAIGINGEQMAKIVAGEAPLTPPKPAAPGAPAANAAAAAPAAKPGIATLGRGFTHAAPPPARDLNPLGMSREEMDAMRGGMDREANPERNFHQDREPSTTRGVKVRKNVTE